MSKEEVTAYSALNDTRLLVIKVGSVLIRGEELDTVNKPWMESLAHDVAGLMEKGVKVVIVSSGGVALGRKALGISAEISPGSIRLDQKQAASAVGQYHMFNGYYNAFQKFGVTAAQVLLTMSETENRRMNLNARETLYTLLDKGIVPVINENDTVSTGEIRFGDNDRLSVRVAQMINADTVLLLSTTDGLYTANPDIDPEARHFSIVREIESKHVKMAGDAIPGLSTGGMKSKIEAAQSSTKAGINLIISKGTENHVIKSLLTDPKRKSTLFLAQKSDVSARIKWLQSHLRPRGILIIDEGAHDALKKGKSLLPVGVKKIEGHFQRGDAVEIRTQTGKKVGMGLSAYDVADAKQIIGKNSAEISGILGYSGRDVLVHRNDLVLGD
ncbi:MAG: glutamate 5-kinase [Alphaproteobacteria bacterium]|nr:glutamate 5-kinase [Alphaproteobacteria bacterium]MCB9974607.1 glutamate 5-kinase [Rhodospirillales bacterium]